MKKVKKKILRPSTLDVIKAMRRGGREAEQELLGTGLLMAKMLTLGIAQTSLALHSLNRIIPFTQ